MTFFWIWTILLFLYCSLTLLSHYFTVQLNDKQLNQPGKRNLDHQEVHQMEVHQFFVDGLHDIKILQLTLHRYKYLQFFSLPYVGWQWEMNDAVLHNFYLSGDSSCSLKISDWLISLKPEKNLVWHYKVRIWSWCFHSFFRKGSREWAQMPVIICFPRTMPCWVQVRPKLLMTFSRGSLDGKHFREWSYRKIHRKIFKRN